MLFDLRTFLTKLNERRSAVDPMLQAIIATVAIFVVALVVRWVFDKIFIYYMSRSYVDEIAAAFNLNKHLAEAISVAVFIVIAFLSGKALSFSQQSRRLGQLGLFTLLIGNSLLLWQGTRDHPFDWRGEALKCYVLTHEGEVRYQERPGVDPLTGRPCRTVTPELADRLRQYSMGKRPQRITSEDPMFFDVRSGEPNVWFAKDKDVTVEIFDLMGFHPETGEELQPVTRDVVNLWKEQVLERKRREADSQRRPPQRINEPESFAFFDGTSGKPRVWYWRDAKGEYEFYDNPGFHPRTGEQLTAITKDAIFDWKRAAAQERERVEREQRSREAAQAQRERERQAALAKEEREQRALVEKQEHEQQAALEKRKREEDAASQCDSLAANPTDPRKAANVAGTAFDDLKMQSKFAVDVCAIAMNANPGEPRYRYQYARALQVDDPKKALEVQRQLARENYPAAFDNTGWLIIRTRKDFTQAIEYFREGAKRGDADSLVSLADMIERNYLHEDDPAAAKLALLSRAAKLGHPGAQLAIERERSRFQQIQQQRELEIQQQQLMLRMLGTVLQNVVR